MKEIKRFGIGKRMSKAVVFNHTAYLTGQVAEDRSRDVKEQTRSVLERIDAILDGVGTDKTKLLSATVYLKDMKDYAAMNAVWDAWVPEGHAPARACVRAEMAAKDILVEISAIAAV